MIKKYSRICLVIFFLIFMGIIDYPFLSRLYNERVQGQAVVSYNQSVESLQKEEREKRLQKAREYNKKLAQGGDAVLEDTFLKQKEPEAETGRKDCNMLNVGEEDTIGIIEIPKINVSIPIYGDTSEKKLQKGAGLLEGSSLPIGGESTHTCISAHRGLPGKTMFTSLDLLEKGDFFYITVLGEKLAYQVTGIQTVKPDEAEALAIQQGRDLATLITCTPYGINTHRLYVHGSRIVIPEEKEPAAEIPTESFWRKWGWVPLNIGLLLWLALLLYFTGKRKTRK